MMTVAPLRMCPHTVSNVSATVGPLRLDRGERALLAHLEDLPIEEDDGLSRRMSATRLATHYDTRRTPKAALAIKSE